MNGGGKGASGSERDGLKLGLSLGIGENATPFEPSRELEFLNLSEEGISSSSAAGGGSGSIRVLVGGCSAAEERETEDEHNLQIKRAKSTDIDCRISPIMLKGGNSDALAPFSHERGEGNDSTSDKVEEYECRGDLSADLLHMVFSLLDQIDICRCAMVCKQWRTISTHEDLWRCLNFEDRCISSEQFRDMCCRYPNATEMNILQTPSVHELAMTAVSSLRNLEVLALGKGPLGVRFFKALSKCPMLRSLTINDAVLGSEFQKISIFHKRLSHIQITKCLVMCVAVRCPQLTTLSLKSSTVGHAVLKCPLLLDLDLGSCYMLSDDSIRRAATSCPLLDSLDISCCSSVSEDTLRVIAEACANLRVLDASYCPNISLESVRLNMLTILKLNSCKGIKTASMSAIANSHMLEVLEIKSCWMLTTMTLELPRLTTLKLVDCNAFVDLSLRCPNLSSITVSNCAALHGISIMSNSLQKLVLKTQERLSTLVLQCPSLQELNLTGCESLRDVICQVFSDGGGCPVLKSLIFDDCKSLKSVQLSSSSLMSLSLVGCRGITNLELQCPHLELLYLDGCDRIECASFSSVSKSKRCYFPLTYPSELVHCCNMVDTPVGLTSLNLGICHKLVKLNVAAPHMVLLELKGCGLLSEASIKCPMLVSLDASFCRQLTDECLSTTSACPLIVSLILMSCACVGSEGLLSLRWLQNLTSLDLSYTLLVDLEPVYKACRQLKVLKLQACKHLADTALEPLYKEGALPALKELDLSYGTLCQRAIEELLAYCTQLTLVSLDGCINVHDLDWGSSSDHLYQFRDSCVSSELSSDQPTVPATRLLQNLTFVGCQNIRKVHIPPAAQCSFLSSLNLSLTAKLKEVDLTCSNLSILNLSNCSSLEILKLQCPKLTSLFLQFCNIDEPALEDSISQCHLLDTLDIRSCPKIPPSCMEGLRAAYPNLKRIFTSATMSIGQADRRCALSSFSDQVFQLQVIAP